MALAVPVPCPVQLFAVSVTRLLVPAACGAAENLPASATPAQRRCSGKSRLIYSPPALANESDDANGLVLPGSAIRLQRYCMVWMCIASVFQIVGTRFLGILRRGFRSPCPYRNKPLFSRSLGPFGVSRRSIHLNGNIQHWNFGAGDAPRHVRPCMRAVGSLGR